jgi:nitrite reductase/ring-hydroxylating ferredoxin subunit
MASYLKAATAGELKDGDKKKVSLNGQDIMLARRGSNYYAVANRCPHFGGNLANGTLEGNIITCPLHGSQFDIRNGKNVRWMKGSGLLSAIGKTLKSPRDLQTYKVKVDGDTVSIEV